MSGLPSSQCLAQIKRSGSADEQNQQRMKREREVARVQGAANCLSTALEARSWVKGVSPEGEGTGTGDRQGGKGDMSASLSCCGQQRPISTGDPKKLHRVSLTIVSWKGRGGRGLYPLTPIPCQWALLTLLHV